MEESISLTAPRMQWARPEQARPSLQQEMAIPKTGKASTTGTFYQAKDDGSRSTLILL